jgi:hypothetical protein
MSRKIEDGKKFFLILPPFFYLNLSSPSGIATCTALHAIRRFRRQYCSRGSNLDKYTLLLYIIREILRGRGLFHVTGTCKHLCYGTLLERVTVLAPSCLSLKDIKFLFATCKKGLATACKIQKIRENKRVLHAVVEFLPAACRRVADCL